MDAKDDLADRLARHFKPHGVVQWGPRGEALDERLPADGTSSTMIVFLDTDGHNSMRALTFNEIVEAMRKLEEED